MYPSTARIYKRQKIWERLEPGIDAKVPTSAGQGCLSCIVPSPCIGMPNNADAKLKTCQPPSNLLLPIFLPGCVVRMEAAVDVTGKIGWTNRSTGWLLYLPKLTSEELLYAATLPKTKFWKSSDLSKRLIFIPSGVRGLQQLRDL